MSESRGRVGFALAVLFAINAMNFFDRQILAAVQEMIRAEWQLSDSSIGGLGTAFILLYAVVGLPLGRLADLAPRKWILSIGVAVWSLLTLLSGFAWNYASLFAFRLGVGVGEASCAPAASSLIGDLVPAGKRARAMSLFMLGLPVGLALSFAVSATVAKSYGWKAAFWVAGVPGLLLALAALAIVEPPRAVRAAGAGPMPFWPAVRSMLRLPTMWWIIASGALHNFNMYAIGTFLASLLKRYHRVDIDTAGWISGLVYGFGAIGIYAAGWLGDRAYQTNKRARLQVAWIAMALSIPCWWFALAAPAGSSTRCAAWLLPACLCMYAYYGTVYATIQDIVAPALRGTAMAVYFFAMYLLGGVLGPVVTGWLSDASARQAALAAGSTAVEELHKAIGLHDAMHIVPLVNVALAAVLFAASRTVLGDLERRASADA